VARLAELVAFGLVVLVGLGAAAGLWLGSHRAAPAAAPSTPTTATTQSDQQRFCAALDAFIGAKASTTAAMDRSFELSLDASRNAANETACA